MAVTYEKYTSISGVDFIRRFNEDGTYSDIPLDQANSDYQRYLNSEAEQSTPNLAD
jgi:hypothetical protein